MDSHSQPPVLITGGAGFIGSHVVRHFLNRGEHVVVLDALTYAGDLHRLDDVSHETDTGRFVFVHGSVTDPSLVRACFAKHQPRAVLHLAAESHVDRSIDTPTQFIETNIVGTQVLLDASLDYFRTLAREASDAFRFLYVSTDEVFGSVEQGRFFTEDTPFAPSSPYAASKAAGDLLTFAYAKTFGLPVLAMNPSNTFGPWQLPEKFIPVLIARGLAGEPMPIFGSGEQIRTWLFVTDFCDALEAILQRGRLGERYLVGSQTHDVTNFQVAEQLCDLLDALAPQSQGTPSRRALLKHVADRPAHDARYAMDGTKITRELGWKAKISFLQGLQETVAWYLEHQRWMEEKIRAGNLNQRRGLPKS